MHLQKCFVRAGSRRVAPLVVAVSMLGIFSGCSTYRVAPGPTIADTPVNRGVTAFDAAVETFARDLKVTAAMSPTDSAQAAIAALKAFKSGLAMLDLQCDRYLDAVGGANQAASNERKQVGLIGGFTSAIMGLTGSPAQHIAGVATSFSFAASSMDSFTTAYLFSDAASSVTKIVRESQVAWLTALSGASNLTGLDYSGTIALLTRYESLCRPAQIRTLIDQSIAKGTVVAVTAQPSDSDVTSVLVTLNASFRRPFTELEAINLYAWYKFPAERGAGPKLSSNDPAALLLKDFNEAELERRLAQAFLSISLAGSPVPARWEPGVQALRKVAVAAAPVPVPAPPGLPTPSSLPAPIAVATAPTTIVPPPVSNIQLRMPSLTIR